MLSLLKYVWNSVGGQTEEKRRELQGLFEKESRYLNEVEAKAQEEENLLEESSIYCNPKEDSNKTIKETECSKRLGTVTRLDSNHGFIDNTIFFEIKVAAQLSSELKVGSKIHYLLYHNPRTDHLTVVKIEGIIDQYWDQHDDDNIENIEDEVENHQPLEYFSTSQRNIMGTIIGVIPTGIIVETEFKTLDVCLNEVKCDFEPKKGDRVYLCTKVQSDEGYVDRQGAILEVLGIFPARILTGEKLSVNLVNDDWGILNDDCYITFDILPADDEKLLNVGDIIKGDIIECERGKFNWRCIRFTMLKKAAVENVEATMENSSPQSQRSGNRLITVTEDQLCVFGGLGQEQTITITVANNGEKKMFAQNITFTNHYPGAINLIDSNITTKGFEIPINSTFDIKFRVESKFFGQLRETFIINFGFFRVKRSIIVNACKDEETAEKIRSKNAAQNQNTTTNATIFNAARNTRSRFYANKVWSGKGARP